MIILLRRGCRECLSVPYVVPTQSRICIHGTTLHSSRASHHLRKLASGCAPSAHEVDDKVSGLMLGRYLPGAR